MWNVGLDESQAGIEITGRNIDINKLKYANRRKWRGTKEPLGEGERGEGKAGLKLNIQKTKIMASSPITSWQKEGRKVKAVIDFIFLGPQSHLRPWLPWNSKMFAPWKENYFADKGPCSQSYGFSSSHLRVPGTARRS